MKYLFIFPANIVLAVFCLFILLFLYVRIALYTVWHMKRPAHDQWKIWKTHGTGAILTPENPKTFLEDIRIKKWQHLFTKTI